MVSKQVSLTSEQLELTDIEAFTDMVFEKGWTDGFPVFPPTPRIVGNMIKYLKRPPDEVVGIVAPAEGVATIEKIAINCAMAGCKPEYVPVVITALEAMMDETQGNQMAAGQSTMGGGQMALISGPVVKKLGFNYAEGALTGSGHRVNGTIARAIRLICWNIGQSKPGQLSAAVFGQSVRWGCLLAERPRDDGNPWNEFHVDYAGLKPEDSAVTMTGGGRQFETGFAAASIEANTYTIAKTIGGAGMNGDRGASGISATGHILVINPQAARILTQAGWTKERFRDSIYEQCYTTVREIKKLASQASPTRPDYWKKRVNPDDDDARLYIMLNPSQLRITVSGGWSASHVCYVFGGNGVTKKINWSWD